MREKDETFSKTNFDLNNPFIDAENGSPFICGGVSKGNYPGNYTAYCYRYNAGQDEWQFSGAMAESKAYAAYASAESQGSQPYRTSAFPFSISYSYSTNHQSILMLRAVH